ncbi:MAG: DUF2281 domain-containing protein [Bacteroidia bacterium]
MSDLTLFTKINQLSDDLKIEVMDFLEYLLSKKKQKKSRKTPKAGFLKGTFIIHDDFNEPLEDFKNYME